MKIGEKIKLSREKRKITQKDLAKKAGISNTYLSDIERMRTNPSIKVLEKLADALEEEVCSFLE
ncbi:HTH-type transcriptional regulator sinR [uncultured Clostridium sp.]|uniref:helix-turn-helix domain-containing protein n=1 Tax=uncultured Clostridium sp. TaxID=59620 RepID=UPI00082028BE|nr:helix-turn-helix transcriptional regulator [uncultured Clostridium sp.]SCJ36346.1 HTH-type transcriptional regulator sinR [uncultured Clostridium sp.]